MKMNERFNWAVEMLHVHPDDRILEIGCGHGIAVSLIAPQLKKGFITAIDSSPAMIDKAIRKNAGLKASFVNGSLIEAPLKDRQFDKIFAFNVNVFHKDAEKELELIRDYLAPLGALYIFHQPPPTDNIDVVKSFADKISGELAKGGYLIRDVLYKRISPSPCVCIISQPSVIAGSSRATA
ncbi:class I SAM-dependent methyltransferase [Chitinophaga barathri]|uniref:Class I SAM-dependent methyltransferase n=1 Tax=Chitinophaga barathri TaxID=1647451 RepID=A0A3N4MA53_9BACT|nr:class I SAM-dependent methyltransferase [Chitinophaga barathri]RPD38247.1 class I SAM-dependent methyltransferase [Chitinophaga barathri]